MKKLEFKVTGSRGNIYTVEFTRDGSNLNAICDCEAGQNGIYCKHRFALMDGDCEDIVSDNEDDLDVLREMLAGTDVEAAYKIVLQAEQEYETAKRSLSAAKKALARAMYR